MKFTSQPATLRDGLLTYTRVNLARARAGFRYDPMRGDYIYNSNGRVVSDAKIEGIESTEYIKFVGDNVEFQTNRLLDGRINLPQWQRQMQRELRDGWRTEYILGRGGVEQMTQADWGRIGGRLNFQYRKLNDFADRIASGELTPGQIQANAQLYANSMRTSLFDGQTQAMIAAGMTEERRVLNPAEHCPDCIGYAAQGWVPIFTLPEPGQQSVCMTNCKCNKEYR